MKPNQTEQLSLILAEGEGQKVEFKEALGRLDREMVAFANATGGSIFLGVDDDGQVVGFKTTNELRRRIQDIAHNCDPTVSISLRKHSSDVLEIVVSEGTDKPYQCREGFFIRNGPNCQKLTRDQVARIVLTTGAHHFDEAINERLRFPRDFDRAKLKRYLSLAGIEHKARAERILTSLDVAEFHGKNLRLRQAGVLFFAKEPQRFLKESYITCVRYEGADRFGILDRADFHGDPISMIEETLAFVRRNTAVRQRVTGDAQHRELFEYPPVAVREAVVNAVMHRDYYYDGSHTFIHIFSDRLEVENPGGLPAGLLPEELGRHSVRRNRTIADLLYRVRYVERIGSGIQRMERALADNGNPPMEITATNFFVVRFYPRIARGGSIALTSRQARILRLAADKGMLTKGEVAEALGVSGDTALRDISALVHSGILIKQGVGRGTKYLLGGGERGTSR